MLDKFSDRERYMIMGLAVFLIILLLVFGISRMVGMVGHKADDVLRYKNYLNKIIQLKNVLKSLPPASVLPDGTELAAQLSGLTKKHNLKTPNFKTGKSTARHYEEIKISMSFNGVSLRDIFALIHDIEYGNKIPAGVRRFQFNRSLSAKELYDVRLTLAVRRPKGKRKRR